MEKKIEKPTATVKPKMGRPANSEPKKGIEMSLENGNLVIKIPAKGLLQRLVSELV